MKLLSFLNVYLWIVLVHFGGPALFSVGCAVLSGALLINYKYVYVCVTGGSCCGETCSSVQVQTRSDVPEGVVMVL